MKRPFHRSHRRTTAHVQALNPFVVDSGLGGRSVFIGKDVLGGPFFYCPFEGYRDRYLDSPNMVIVGTLGTAKSAQAKTLAWRQLAFGRQPWVVDPKGEYGPLCRAAGVTPIRLEPGGAVRLNPLETPAVADANAPQHQLQARVRILGAILGPLLRRPMTAEERATGAMAIEAATPSRGTAPTLGGVFAALMEPGDAAARRLRTNRKHLAAAGREMGLHLWRLVDGDLSGMFDGETAGPISTEAPMVCFDLSGSRLDSDGLSVVMVSIAAWLHQAVTKRDGRQRIVILDEAWSLLRHVEIVRLLRNHWKLARAYGVQNIAVLHRFTDLDAAGDAHSEQVRIAHGLVSDSQTRVLYAQSPDQVTIAREVCQLTEVEAAILPNLPPGRALWKVGQRSFLVDHHLSAAEQAIVNTDAAMLGQRDDGLS